MNGNILFPPSPADYNEPQTSSMQLATTFSNDSEQAEPTESPDIASRVVNDAEPPSATVSRSPVNDCVGNGSRHQGAARDVRGETDMQKRRRQQGQSGSAGDSISSLVLTNGLHTDAEPGKERDFDDKEGAAIQSHSAPRGSAALEERALANKLLYSETLSSVCFQPHQDTAELLDSEDGEEHLR